VDILIKVKELKPDILSSYLNLGIGYIKIGEVEKASIILKQGIELFPSNAHLYYNLGVAYHYMDEVQLAEETYNIAYSLDPEHPQTLYNLALIYHSRDDTEKALKYWEEYIEVAKDKPEERIYLERALEMMSELIYENTLKDLSE
jgi:tetratricopeptide (TPR) repeat protein